MDNEIIKNLLMLLQWLTTCALAVYAHNIGKQRATTESINQIRDKLAEKCLRIAKLEAQLPSRNELIRLHERMDREAKEMHVELSKVNDRLDDMRQSQNERLDLIARDSKESSLLLGQVLGQLKQINEDKR